VLEAAQGAGPMGRDMEEEARSHMPVFPTAALSRGREDRL